MVIWQSEMLSLKKLFLSLSIFMIQVFIDFCHFNLSHDLKSCMTINW